jgi:TolA-binding protein
MISHKSIYRYIFVLIATIAFLLALPHRAVADPSNKLTEEEIFYQQSYLMLSTKKYKELDQRFKQYLDLYARSEITAEELSIKFETFSKTPGLEPRYDEWVKAYPQSYSARLARGIYRVTDAWGKRGDQMAQRTTDDQFRGFNETLKDAQSDLMISITLYARPVDSYRYLIRISKGLSLGTERDLLDAALKLDPKAYEVRSDYFDAITPRWGGDEEMMASFLDESNKSPMSDKNKKKFEGVYYYAMAQQARLEKDYKAGSDYFYKYYLTNKIPSVLQWSGQVASDGDFKDLAFVRFNQLATEYPAYPYGFELRGILYETHLKDIKKAIQDYLTASGLGASWSQNHMGWYYMMGINVPVDYVKAKHYLDLAAAQGNNTAKENLVTLKQLLSHSDKTSSTEAKQPNKSLKR